MNDEPLNRPLNQFIQTEKQPAGESAPGMRQVWIVIALVLLFEIIGAVWFFRTYGWSSSPKGAQAGTASTPDAKR
jgi:hypothetical protein